MHLFTTKMQNSRLLAKSMAEPAGRANNTHIYGENAEFVIFVDKVRPGRPPWRNIAYIHEEMRFPRRAPGTNDGKAGGLVGWRTAVRDAEYIYLRRKTDIERFSRELQRNWQACRRAFWTRMSGTEKDYRTRMKLHNLLFSEPRTREYFVFLSTTVVFSAVRNFPEIGQSTSARNLAKIGKSNLQY